MGRLNHPRTRTTWGRCTGSSTTLVGARSTLGWPPGRWDRGARPPPKRAGWISPSSDSRTSPGAARICSAPVCINSHTRDEGRGHLTPLSLPWQGERPKIAEDRVQAPIGSERFLPSVKLWRKAPSRPRSPPEPSKDSLKLECTAGGRSRTPAHRSAHCGGVLHSRRSRGAEVASATNFDTVHIRSASTRSWASANTSR